MLRKIGDHLPLSAPERGGSCVWGQDLACVPGILSFTCGLLMQFNSKKKKKRKLISKMCLDHRNIYIFLSMVEVPP